MRRRLIQAGALVAVLALALAGAAAASRKVERFGNLFIADNGGISPSKLPRHGSAPITARIDGEIGTVDGTHPPALRTLELDVDKTIHIDAVGLPTCKPRQLQARTSAAAKTACGGALVGSGRAEVEVAFPESKPFSATGPVLLFNGGVHGSTTLVILHAYVSVPAPTAVVATAAVTRIHRGRFGLEIATTIPEIAGGAGSPTRFQLKIGRQYAHQGQTKSFLTAGCPTGSWVTEGHVVFADGTQAGLTHLFPCTPVG